jgi:hypothetical protein
MSRHYTDTRHHTTRFAAKPRGDGWTAHKGKKAPVAGDVLIETAHKTDEGYAIGPRRNVKFVRPEEWALPQSEPGAIVAWRLAPEIKPSPDVPVGENLGDDQS